jgi:antitoxin component YwqK of YwqJK toxin-antitoxin module
VFYVDGGLQGPLMTWYDNGQKREETQFEGNQPHGLWTTWHDNGQKRSESYYEDGRKVGLWRMWDRDGKLVDEQDHGSVAAETVN